MPDAKKGERSQEPPETAEPLPEPVPAPPVAVSAVVHVGKALAPFTTMHRGSVMSFYAGQQIKADAMLRATLSGAPVEWST